ncbi:MAG: hypothetical protein QW674_05605 [Candidatus Bathyarchaeia archaeon]
MQTYELRNFADGDETKIVELFNDANGRLSGYVPRTVEYWRWCCLKRPDVKKDGIFLIFDKTTGNLEGYVVAGLSGNIWEFCIRSTCEDTALILLDKAIGYLADMGVSAVNVCVPKDDPVLNGVCRKLGFAQVDIHKLFVGVLSFRKLISIVIQYKAAVLTKKFNEKICITLENPPSWVERAISISVDDKGVNVSEGVIEFPTVSIKVDAKTLFSILVGVQSPRQALLKFNMHVKPLWKALVAERFLRSLRMNFSWFWPLGDFG